MLRILLLVILLAPLAGRGQTPEASPVKFAFYSPSWASNSETNLLSDLRLVVDNRSDRGIRLQRIEFAPSDEEDAAVSIDVDMLIAAGSLAERELPYRNLLNINDCVSETLGESWRLVEISNYTLNPSVRRLIIEDTSAFRIYQCVSTVRTTWIDTATGAMQSFDEWVLYHFESRAD